MRRIAVLSHIVLDEVHHDGSMEAQVEVGGAGAYAAAGASLAGSAGSGGSAVLVAGVGAADRDVLSAWCGAREIDDSGLFDVSHRSPRTVVRYLPDGEREETPVFGLEHFDAHTPLPRHIPYPVDRIAGLYLFHDHGSDYWDDVAEHRARTSVPFLWEISAASCRPEALGDVRERLELVDVLSINRTEALALFGVRGVDEVVRALSSLPVTTVLRLGAEGSLVIDGTSTWVGVAEVEALDPTGGGNSYSGAYLAALVESGDAVGSARLATAVAAAVVSGPGAPLVDDEARARARETATRIPIERRPTP